MPQCRCLIPHHSTPPSLHVTPLTRQTTWRPFLLQLYGERDTNAETIVRRALLLSLFVPRDDGTIWRLLERYSAPPIERLLRPTEDVLAVCTAWPPSDSGCTLVLRPFAEGTCGTPDWQRVGQMDKRGGKHRNWKSRHFTLSPVGAPGQPEQPRAGDLRYYRCRPETARQLAAPPLGLWPCHGATVYAVRHLKKAPRPSMCLCIRLPQPPTATGAPGPLWPAELEVRLAAFEDECKFMCAPDEKARRDWLASLDLVAAAGLEGPLPASGLDSLRPAYAREFLFHTPTCPRAVPCRPHLMQGCSPVHGRCLRAHVIASSSLEALQPWNGYPICKFPSLRQMTLRQPPP